MSMEGIEEVEYNDARSSTTQSVLAGPPSGDARQTRGKTTSTSVHRQGGPTITTDTVSNWTGTSSQGLPNPDEGLVESLSVHNSALFREILLAIERYQSAVSTPEVPDLCEIWQNHKLWQGGEVCRIHSRCQAFGRRLPEFSIALHENKPSSKPHNTEDRGKLHLKLADSPSSGGMPSSEHQSVVSEFYDNGSARPLTGTNTFISTSLSQLPHAETTAPSLAREHSNCENCNGGPGRSEEPLEIFKEDQFVEISNRNGQPSEFHPALFDSGSSFDFILRYVVEKHGLQIHHLPGEGETYESIDGVERQTNEYVEPTWRLRQGTKQHCKYQFLVVDRLPDDIRVVVGKHTSNEMGIHFYAKKGTLVAHSKKGHNTREQSRHASHALDNSTRRAQMQKVLEKNGADAVKSSQQKEPQEGATPRQVAKGEGHSQTRSTS